ncbi:MAG: dna modification methylase protein, partial [Rubritepida sp.]|nr:dna modification methylase protein [Rubritepida sp.]
MLEFGWTNSMLIADGQMLAGHGRLESALQLAKEGKTIPRNPDPWSGPTVDLSHFSPVQRRAYVLQDNQSALGSSWDPDMLAMELGDLREELGDADMMRMTAFDADDIASLLAAPLTDGLTDPDDAPPAPVHPVTVLGDVWLLGPHRILCGSSTDAADVEKV